MPFVLSLLLQTVRGVKALQDADCFPQALVVLYAAIDNLAWLGSEGDEITGKTFIEWVERYMVPGSPLPCNGMELYAARCALLHTGTAESRLSRRRAARQIWYYGSGRSQEFLNQEITDRTDVVGVRVVELVEAFAGGATRFADALAADDTLGNRARERAKLWLQWVAPGGEGRRGA